MIICKTCREDVSNAGVCTSMGCKKDQGYLEWQSEVETIHNHKNPPVPKGWRLPTLSELQTYGPKLLNHRDVKKAWYWSSTKDNKKPIMTKCYHLDSQKIQNFNKSAFIWVCHVRDR